MDKNLTEIKTKVYDKCGSAISELELEPESSAYEACQYRLIGLISIGKTAK